MRLFYLPFIFLLNTLLYAQQGSTLNVKIDNIKSNKGNIIIGLYNGPENFPKEKPYKEVTISPKKNASYSFNNLTKGVYALAILHDENKNRKMDIGMFGPKESYGFSNNVKVLFNPPSFEKASFTLDGENTKNLNIKLK